MFGEERETLLLLQKVFIMAVTKPEPTLEGKVNLDSWGLGMRHHRRSHVQCMAVGLWAVLLTGMKERCEELGGESYMTLAILSLFPLFRHQGGRGRNLESSMKPRPISFKQQSELGQVQGLAPLLTMWVTDKSYNLPSLASYSVKSGHFYCGLDSKEPN